MQYRMLVKKVADYSGFSDKESETALRLFVGTLAARLTPGERKDFVSQLPEELKKVSDDIDTEAVPASAEDFYNTFSELQDIDRGHAKKQILAAWQAIKDAITPGEISHIRSQLPGDLVAELH